MYARTARHAKEFFMKNLHKLGIAALALAIVFSFAACNTTTSNGSSSPPNTDPKTLVITGFTSSVAATYFPAGGAVAVYSPGANRQSVAPVAIGDYVSPDSDGETYTIPLKTLDGKEWTGNGVYEIDVIDKPGAPTKGATAKNVNFNQAVVTVAWDSFKDKW
jgi:hypothetical protein